MLAEEMRASCRESCSDKGYVSLLELPSHSTEQPTLPFPLTLSLPLPEDPDLLAGLLCPVPRLAFRPSFQGILDRVLRLFGEVLLQDLQQSQFRQVAAFDGGLEGGEDVLRDIAFRGSGGCVCGWLEGGGVRYGCL